MIKRKGREGGKERDRNEEKSRDFVRPSFRFRIVARKNNYGKITAMFKYGSAGEKVCAPTMTEMCIQLYRETRFLFLFNRPLLLPLS